MLPRLAHFKACLQNIATVNVAYFLNRLPVTPTNLYKLRTEITVQANFINPLCFL